MPLRIVLDTNVMLVSLSNRSPYHWIIRALGAGKYRLLVSTGILLEYEEVIADRMGRRYANLLAEIIETSPYVVEVGPSFQWTLLADPDDNKFVDCAVSGQADYIVTYDRHFDPLQEIGFPRVDVITPEELKALLEDAADHRPPLRKEKKKP